jgi:transposase
VKRTVVKVENSEEGINQLCSCYVKKKDQVVFVMEATGGCESLLLKILGKSQIPAAVVNPRHVRDFAKGIGWDAKTDPIDSKVLSRYGEVVMLEPMAAKSDHEEKHSALAARRNQLLELINQESNRRKQSWDEDAKTVFRK